jgi:ribosomal protein L37AE/L43A
MPEAMESAEMPLAAASAQLAEVLSRPAPAAKPAISSCPSCKASLSGVELKFEKCLSCGKSFVGSANSVSVSVGI